MHSARVIPHERIEYRGWTVEVQRKAFRRSISIILRPHKPVIVRAARLTPLRTILEFVDTRAEWIEKHLAAFREQEKTLPARTLNEGDVYPFRGRALRLKAVLTPLNQVFVSAVDDELRVHLPATLYRERAGDLSFARPMLRDFYRREGARFLKERAAHWAALTGLRPSSVGVREARTRWGSCNRHGRVSLNWRLMVFRPEVIDYVIVHELSHLRHLDHSKNFWGLVESILPESATLAREIRDQHRLSDFLAVEPGR